MKLNGSLLKGYSSKLSKNDTLKEIEDSLSPVEKMLCSTFGRVEIQGKKVAQFLQNSINTSLQDQIVILAIQYEALMLSGDLQMKHICLHQKMSLAPSSGSMLQLYHKY